MLTKPNIEKDLSKFESGIASDPSEAWRQEQMQRAAAYRDRLRQNGRDRMNRDHPEYWAHMDRPSTPVRPREPSPPPLPWIQARKKAVSDWVAGRKSDTKSWLRRHRGELIFYGAVSALLGIPSASIWGACAGYGRKPKKADDDARAADKKAREDDEKEDKRRQSLGLPLAPGKRNLSRATN